MSEERELSFKEITQLSYYELNAHIGVPYFHQGGMRATDRLADLCNIGSETKVLIVGCGTGYSACYLARTRNCRVDGFDLAENMITKAKIRAGVEGVTDKVTFQIADAHHLPFEDGQFDVVLTEFVSMFLDRDKAYPECVRVLRPGGHFGINELCKEDIIPEASRIKIEKFERNYAEVANLPFSAPSISAWCQEFQKVGLLDIQSEKVDYQENLRERANSVGGRRKLLAMIGRGFLYMFKSKEIRRKMLIQASFKRILKQDKSTRQYIGAFLWTGKKSNDDE